MTVRFHSAVQREVSEVLDYYSERSMRTADQFWDELEARIEEIAENPKRFTLLDPIRGLRRAKLRKFSYMILYYISAHGVKISCVKHEKRHPNAGMSRR